MRTWIAPLVLFLAALGVSIYIVSDSMSRDGHSPNGILLASTESLPEDAISEEPPPDLCGPLPVLASNGAQTATSPMFTMDRTRLAEAAGLFETSEAADDAYDALNSRRRIACIRDAIEGYGREVKSVSALPPRHLGLGEEDSRVRYLVFDSDSRAGRFADVVSIRSGECIVALIFLVTSDNRDLPLVSDLSEDAADAVDSACG